MANESTQEPQEAPQRPKVIPKGQSTPARPTATQSPQEALESIPPGDIAADTKPSSTETEPSPPMTFRPRGLIREIKEK